MQNAKQKSSYQRLKEAHLQLQEQHQIEMKILLDGTDDKAIEVLKEKYKFLKNQKVKTLFGKASSISGRALNKFLQSDFST